MKSKIITKFPEQRLWRIEPRSEHPERIVYIYEALKKLPLPENFSVLDLAAGHGTVVNGLKRLFPKSKCQIVDIVRYPEWNNLSRYIKVYVEPLQMFIKRPGKYDVVMMLNSFRNWSGGSMRNRARREFLEWLPEHAKYFITSVGKPHHRPPSSALEEGEINGYDYANFFLKLYKVKEKKL